MDFGIRKKTAIVLGAGGGLGRAIALSLASEGVNIAACDINEDALAEVVNLVNVQGVQGRAYRLDLRDINDLESAVDAIRNDLGAVEILVNNTGGPAPTTAAGVDAKMWQEQFNAMVLSVMKLTDLVLPDMKAAQWGRIITSTSSGVVAPIPNLGISNSLRMALVGWSKTLAREVGRDGVTVNIILPGRIATQRIQQLDEAKAKRENRAVEDIVQESTSSIPVGRYGDPKEYGDVVAFLASMNAAYVTGSVIRVDGGLIPSV